jgi:hypothetical protein
MNLQDQIGALEAGVNQLIEAVAAIHAAYSASTNAAPSAVAHAEPASQDAAQPAEPIAAAAEAESAGTPAHEAATPADKPTLQIGRPSQNEITMTIGEQTVSLHPLQVGQLIEELANARASMAPEAPPEIPPGWRFVSTKNPMFAVQKQSSGDRLLVLRHTGHGWVPFTFSPDKAIELYMMLTQR